jgi:integrase
MVEEATVREGFLSDEQYAKLRDALPQELKALFVTAYLTGIRKGELLAINWNQVDFELRAITLEKGETKNDKPRSVPIVKGNMLDLTSAKNERDEKWRNSPWVFNRAGEPIKDFRWAWNKACEAAGVGRLCGICAAPASHKSSG